MNAIRRIRFAALLGSLSVLALIAVAAPAKAGHGHHGHGHHHFGLYSSYPTALYDSHCHTTPYIYTLKPIYYPVTTYDCFGHPHIVYQTGYTTLLR
jgi:hypothetical protein